MENTCAIHFWSIIWGREDRCPCARAWLWVRKAVNICLKNYSKVVLNTGRVCFILDWPPGWSQNFGSAALHEGETTHLWAWSEASKGGKSFFWGPMKSIDHGFPLGLFHSRWTPLGSIGYSQAEDEASARTGWPQTWIFSPKLYCSAAIPGGALSKAASYTGQWVANGQQNRFYSLLYLSSFLFRLLPGGACANPSLQSPLSTVPKQERRNSCDFCAPEGSRIEALPKPWNVDTWIQPIPPYMLQVLLEALVLKR